MDFKIAMITGATGDIGKAITQRLCTENYQPIIIARTLDKLNILKQEIEDKFNIIPIVFCCDVSKSEEVKSVLNKIQKLNYYVDLLVNCAGKSCGGNTIDITDEEWDDVIKTNLNSIFYITRGLLSRNMIRKDGRIINIASTGGKQGVIYGVPYSASKHGVVGFSKSLGLELARARTGITVNAICPGFVESEIAKKVRKIYSKIWNIDVNEVKKRVEGRIPIGRYIEPFEVANMVAYIASPEASGITSQAINICGGLGNY